LVSRAHTRITHRAKMWLPSQAPLSWASRKLSRQLERRTVFVHSSGSSHRGGRSMGVTANYPQERSVNHRGAQLLRMAIVAGRSGKR
jgi:hypothetical protein